MVGILVVSHGRLADALISSVEFLVGNLHRTRGVSIWPKDQEKEVKDRIQKKMAEVNDGEVVTGVNLPMLLTLSSYRKGKSLEEIGRLAKKSGRRSIILAKKLFGLRQGGKWKR